VSDKNVRRNQSSTVAFEEDEPFRNGR